MVTDWKCDMKMADSASANEAQTEKNETNPIFGGNLK
jgi:hypothetical protein